MTSLHRISTAVSRRQLLNAGAAFGALVGVRDSSTGATSGTTATPRPTAPGSSPNRTTALAAGARFAGDPGAGKVYFGASVVGGTDVLAALEAKVGSTVGVHRSYYTPSSLPQMYRVITEAHAKGRLPSVSTKVPDTWASCAAGKQDAWFRTLLTTLQNSGKPVFLTLHHEPEDDAGPTGMRPQDWREMNEHVHALTLSIAPRVTIVPILMQYTFTSMSGRRPADWVPTTTKVFSTDCYNAWSPTNGLAWRSLEEKMDLVMPYAAGRPVVLGEYGCRTDAKQPGRAADWMRDAFDYARTHNIVSMSYFNSYRNSRFGTWEMDAERLAAFKEIIHRPETAWM